MFVIVQKFMSAQGKPPEQTNNLLQIVTVLSVVKEIKLLSMPVLMTTVEASGNVLLPY